MDNLHLEYRSLWLFTQFLLATYMNSPMSTVQYFAELPAKLICQRIRDRIERILKTLDPRVCHQRFKTS